MERSRVLCTAQLVVVGGRRCHLSGGSAVRCSLLLRPPASRARTNQLKSNHRYSRLASLAKLTVSADREDALRAEVESLLSCVRQIQSVDIADVEPTFSLVEPRTLSQLRADQEQPTLGADAVLRVAPETFDGYIAVPKSRPSDES